VLKSMTGFGRGEYKDNEHHITVEMRAVNHRYAEVVIRIPRNLSSLEERARRQILGAISRGRLDVTITVEEHTEKNRMVRVDKELAIAYYNALKELKDLLQTTENFSVPFIAKFPDVMKVEEAAEDVELLWPKIESSIEEAVQFLTSMREREGASIKDDMLHRLDLTGGYIEDIDARAPGVLKDYREKLLGRIREAMLSSEVDENRLMLEIALFADRTNITEELVRFRSHLGQFRDTIHKADAIGRKLDFIVQEMNREVNTIGSKANDFFVANKVVEIKSELEKIREQIQNLE
jgi:uncharacterized protein (TIGR00255 family)